MVLFVIASFSAQRAEVSHHWCFIISEAGVATIMEITDLLCSLITVSQLTLHANIAKLHPPTWPTCCSAFFSAHLIDSSIGIQRLQYSYIN